MLLLGGAPFEEQILIWWNYVARTQDEINVAAQDWDLDTGRFGQRVVSELDKIPSPLPPWTSR